MSDCVNCGKKLNSFTECVDPYGINVTCKNCSRIFSTLVFPKLRYDYNLDNHRTELLSAGVTEAGLSYVDACVLCLKEKKETADAIKDTDTAKKAAEEEYARLNAERIARLEALRKKRMDAFRCDIPDKDGVYYHIEGARGRVLDVYYNKCVITTNVTVGSIITHNATDGEKTIYYVDCTSLQYKRPGITIGYLQLETSGSTMNNKDSNFFNENSFTFNDDAPDTDTAENIISTGEKVEVVVEFIKKRLDEIKGGQAACGALSVVNALKGFKELLDTGVITEEEFEAKKKQLLCI